jgi:hypothetical protein
VRELRLPRMRFQRLSALKRRILEVGDSRQHMDWGRVWTHSMRDPRRVLDRCAYTHRQLSNISVRGTVPVSQLAQRPRTRITEESRRVKAEGVSIGRIIIMQLLTCLQRNARVRCSQTEHSSLRGISCESFAKSSNRKDCKGVVHSLIMAHRTELVESLLS